MKLSIILILLLSACSTTKYHNVFVPLKNVESPCVFEKLTEEEAQFVFALPDTILKLLLDDYYKLVTDAMKEDGVEKTEGQKKHDEMVEAVGRKIRRNQVTCYEKFKTIQKDIEAHNREHNSE